MFFTHKKKNSLSPNRTMDPKATQGSIYGTNIVGDDDVVNYSKLFADFSNNLAVEIDEAFKRVLERIRHKQTKERIFDEERAKFEQELEEDRARRDQALSEERARSKQARAEERARREREWDEESAKIEQELEEDRARRDQALANESAIRKQALSEERARSVRVLEEERARSEQVLNEERAKRTVALDQKQEKLSKYIQQLVADLNSEVQATNKLRESNIQHSLLLRKDVECPFCHKEFHLYGTPVKK